MPDARPSARHAPASPTRRPPADGVTRRPSRVLPICLAVVATAILAQAVLAGLFLSGVPDARMVHLVVGSLLPWVALAVAIVAGVQRRAGRCRAGVAYATAALPVLLFVQEVLGHVPAAATTAVHVPFGVALLSYAVLLTVESARPARAEWSVPAG